MNRIVLFFLIGLQSLLIVPRVAIAEVRDAEAGGFTTTNETIIATSSGRRRSTTLATGGTPTTR